MMQLWADSRSGNCYKLQCILALSQQQCDWHEVDILAGDTRSAAFLQRNPNGKIPLSRLSNGEYLAESNAILWYLSANTAWRPKGRAIEAEILQWLFFEQYSHEPYIATSRFLIQYLGGGPEHAEELRMRQPKGYAALAVMEQHLGRSLYFAGSQCTIADIALYAYTHVAAEGGFNLRDFPAIRRWLQRLSAQPRWPEMAAKAAS